jgi:aminoglycoside/choline kinase family phosphotransferase
MTTDSQQERLGRCFKEVTGQEPTSITELHPHASERRIFRIVSGSTRMIGVLNPSRRENDVFVALAKHFYSLGLPVPLIYHYEPDSNLYLEEDLGDETLLDLLANARASNPNDPFPKSVEDLYRRSLEYLTRFQIESAADLDFSLCYPERDLLPGTFTGDCANFSAQLVTRVLPQFEISQLNSDFAKLISFLGQSDANFFVYRDFQSRNIMHYKSGPYFIDFQSGKRGPLQYDVVSLLYQSSAKIPEAARERLVKHYILSASTYLQIDQEKFYHFFSGFIVARMLQVLGVYGRQGLGAGKPYFINSIPGAVTTLRDELHKKSLPLNLVALRNCVDQLAELFSRT